MHACRMVVQFGLMLFLISVATNSKSVTGLSFYQQSTGDAITTDSVPSDPLQVRSVNVQCPPWFTLQESNGSMVCRCPVHSVNLVDYVVKCNDSSSKTELLSSYCMTYSKDGSKLVVGACMYTVYNARYGNGYFALPGNVTELNGLECGGLNREGQLCGSCKAGYALPAYSYDLACVKCPTHLQSSTLNWLKYAGMSFAPLTAFYAVVLTFRISANSASMNAFVIIAQTLSTPMQLQSLDLRSRVTSATNAAAVFLSSVFGLWNLDPFRAVYKPFCLHQRMTSLQVLALDYLLATYPLLLIGITFLLAKLHDHGFRVVMIMWRPFHRCLVRFRKQWDLQNSLVDAFATFLLLSYVKFLSVSFDLLFPVQLYDMSGQTGKWYLFYDANVEYFGKEHLPFALLAVAVVGVVIIAPIVLLCLYPCRCFQRLLNRLGLRLVILHTFMDAFQGCYKDGTNGTRDCRYFAAIYLLARIGLFMSVALTPFNFSFVLLGIIMTTIAILIAVLRPYKHPAHNSLNVILLMSSVMLIISLLGFVIAFMQSPLLIQLSTVITDTVIFVPILYIPALLLYLLYKKKLSQSRIVTAVRRLRWPSAPPALEESLPDRLIHPSDYPRYTHSDRSPLIP